MKGNLTNTNHNIRPYANANPFPFGLGPIYLHPVILNYLGLLDIGDLGLTKYRTHIRQPNKKIDTYLCSKIIYRYFGTCDF